MCSKDISDDNSESLSFGKNKKLISNDQFKAVLDNGRRLSDPDKSGLILYIAPNDCGYPRLGVSIGKAHGNAVVRNRLKRLLREVFRQNQNKIPPEFDYLLMMSPLRSKKSDAPKKSQVKRKDLTFEQINTTFLNLVKSAKKDNS